MSLDNHALRSQCFNYVLEVTSLNKYARKLHATGNSDVHELWNLSMFNCT